MRVFSKFFSNLLISSSVKEFLTPGKFDFLYYKDEHISQVDEETLEIDPDGSGLSESYLLSSDYIRGFNFLSLRSNFILKWEFQPGSSLFLVWQQQRDYYEITDNEPNIAEGFDKLMQSEAMNTLMLKIAYWFSP